MINQPVTEELFWDCMTIADRVLYLLRTNLWVTTSDFLGCGLYTFRNRISEINRRGRVHIECQPIEGKKICKYRLL